MQTITLRGKAELDIYINPQRQRILREMALCGRPMTPKELAVRMDISASAVQHHIAKLVKLGVVALDHTQNIRGITAHYYRALPVTVRVGYGETPTDAPQRLALIQNGVNDVLNGFAEHARRSPPPVEDQAAFGDVLWGVTRLTGAEAGDLFTLIRGFLAEHDTPDRAGDPWEYALIAYPAQSQGHA